MKKIAVVYTSVHHQNTKKLLEGIKKEVEIEMIASSEVKDKDLFQYDIIGFASGIYAGKCHKTISNLITQGDKFPDKFPKKAFAICTSGMLNMNYIKKMKTLLSDNGFEVLGGFQCKGFDTFAFLKWFGGVAKGHPTEQDIRDATAFVKTLLE